MCYISHNQLCEKKKVVLRPFYRQKNQTQSSKYLKFSIIWIAARSQKS